ncbi:unnamed protein product [Adineta steineri]|uniref:EGF-like domain-containing protein n=1 Tax=Adineta steineri TaxID=433720 RepID=A0A814FFA9_9BILA|nr:unnamed protein product [Adineta steineri]CAF0984278.1 unnamed protein product [Adineta steineri]CAF1499209.1 unnamed protein product [Adineta steineri]CAF4018207.1 unnamed protein product [Adineta steineri]CAF4045016.1 unnamed protein product [Adineta steineri]
MNYYTYKFYYTFCDACGSNPCKNGGKCVTLAAGRRFYCLCTPDGYYGKICENKFQSTRYKTHNTPRKDYCAPGPCNNGGECISLRTTYYCRCRAPYYGINCGKS